MNKKDINIGNYVNYFDGEKHHKGVVIDIDDPFKKFEDDVNMSNHSNYHFEMPKDYTILTDEGEEIQVNSNFDLERDYNTERDVKLNNLLNGDDTDTGE
jgi:hypothetical protein